MIFGYHEIGGFFDIPMRQVGANVPYEWLIYIIMLIPIALVVYGMGKKIQVWTLAQGDLHRDKNILKRIIDVIVYSFAQLRVIRKPLPGWMHFFVFWGFLFLALAAGIDAAHHWIGWPHLEGGLYIGMSWIVDVFGFLALIGVIVLAFIRYVEKPDRLKIGRAHV